MSDQVEKRDFITTIKELMRLTREGVLDWSVDYPSSLGRRLSSTIPDHLPTYTARYEDLIFTIEDAALHTELESSVESPFYSQNKPNTPNPGENYILKIKDTEDSSTISSPPMKPIRDLVSVIEKKPKEEKLEEINKRLSEIRD